MVLSLLTHCVLREELGSYSCLHRGADTTVVEAEELSLCSCLHRGAVTSVVVTEEL